MLLAMFPGQGSHYVGMGRALLDNFPYLSPLFEEAEDFSKLCIRKLCFEGPEPVLTLTENTQPCILTISMAYWKVLVAEAGLKAEFFAGHSLGEYTALVASGRLLFSEAVSLVHARGKYMQQAISPDAGQMIAVIGCDSDEVDRLCKESSTENSIVEVANYNSRKQVVISGHKAAVASVAGRLSDKKVRLVPLQVSAPFHCKLMHPVCEKMRPLIEAVHWEPGTGAMIENVSGKIVKDYSCEALINQIDHSVRWAQSMDVAYESGVNAMLDLGPGRVLWGLARKSLPRSVSLYHTDDIFKLIEEVKDLGSN